jgi:hypothetical protein
MSAEQPVTLADSLRVMISDANGREMRDDAVSALGGWGMIADQLITLADDPVLIPLVSLISRDIVNAGGSTALVLESLVTAVLSTSSPALFGDALNLMAANPIALETVGIQLADGLLAELGGLHELADPDDATVSRAADALETLTRLKAGGFGTPFALFAFLERFRSPAPARLATAAIRSVSTAVDQWPEAVSLREVVMVLAGLKPGNNVATWSGNVDDVASDACWVLSGIDLVQALRSNNLAEMAALFRSSRDYLVIGRDTYGREDAEVLVEVLDLVSVLLDESDSVPSISVLGNSPLTRAKVDAVVDRACRYNVAVCGLEHWFGDAKRASLQAWVALAEDLRTLQVTFAEESFYRAEVIVDDLLRIYVASRSFPVICRDGDFGGILQIVQPVIESGFAAKAGLLAHLGQHVRNLETRLTHANDVSRTEISADLNVAKAVLTKAEGLAFRGGGGPGKVEGAIAAPLPQPLDRLFPTGSAEAAQVAALGQDVLEKLVSAVENQAAARGLSLVEAEVIQSLSTPLAASREYTGDVKVAVDQLLTLLVRFVGDRLNAQYNRKKYLFKADASEDDLHQDLYDYLKSTDLGATTEMEVQHIGGGRIDIRILFDGFGLHIELKADDTQSSMTEKTAYLKQTVAYQATDVRIGFLVALRTKAFDPTGPSPHLTGLFEHTTLSVEGDTVPRHVILIELPGNRTAPSKMR